MYTHKTLEHSSYLVHKMSSLSGCKLTIVNPSHSETYPLNFDFSLFESVFHHILKGITLKGRLRHTVPTNV